MKNKLLFVGFALALCLIQLSSCHKKMCVEDHEEVYEYQVPEVRDTLILNHIIYSTIANDRKWICEIIS